MFGTVGLIGLFSLYILHKAVPGPNMLFLCATTARSGKAGALGFALGTALGTFVWASVVFFGLVQLMEQLPWLTDWLKVSAAILLIGFGVFALRSAFNATVASSPCSRRRFGRALAEGFLITMSNVNELVLWGAILALVAGEPISAGFAWILVIGSTVSCLAFDLCLAFLVAGSGVTGWLMRFRKAVEASMGAAYCGTGVLIAGIL